MSKQGLSRQYHIPRSKLGKQPLFCEVAPEMVDSIPMNIAEQRKYILRNPINQETQCGPTFSEHEINHIRVELKASGANHLEGGWPKDVNIYDIESTDKYRRKIQKEEPYVNCVLGLNKQMEHLIDQNNAIDMYRNFYSEIPPQPELEKRSVRTVNEYRDANPRPVSSIAWQPEGHRFAVTYANLDYYRTPRGPIYANIWDMENANNVEQVIHPPCALLELVYNPNDVNILVGALVSGQVGAWDRRVGGLIQRICEPHVAHRDMTRSVKFINSKSGQEFFSGSADGSCKWWDLRNMSEPTDEMIMDRVESANEKPDMARAAGVVSLEYQTTIPTRFLVGTENGIILAGNRKGKSSEDMIPASFMAHSGPVVSLERNPAYLKFFLTVGDWTVKMWTEDCRESPILWSPLMRRCFTSGAWSPTRCSLMTLTGSDGYFYVWDLLRKQHEAVLSQKISLHPLLRQQFHEGGSLVAMGDTMGAVYMLEVSQHLSVSGSNDKTLLLSMIERETRRERILEARIREIKLKLRQAEEGDEATKFEYIEPPDSDLGQASAEYFTQVKKEITITY